MTKSKKVDKTLNVKGERKKMYESLKRSFKGVLTREEEEREKGMCLHKRERECFED